MGICFHAVPFHRSIKGPLNPLAVAQVVQPTAQALPAETAATPRRSSGLGAPGLGLGTCAHVAIDAGNPGVRGKLVRRELGRHHRVAKLAAELYGIRELVSLITAYHAQSDEDDDKTQKKGKCSSLTGIVEIDSQITRSFSGELQASAAPLEQDSTHDQSQSYNQKSRSHHVGQDADIGAGVL